MAAGSTPRASIKQTLCDMYDRLWAAYGPQHWWPAETATEVVVGVILTQNTAWKNVEPAIENLKAAKCLSFRALRALPENDLAQRVRPAGTYHIKAARLKAFADCLYNHCNGSLDAMLDGDLDIARNRLLAIHGIGPESADSILLYAGSRPTFVVDAYTKRILRRHLVIDRHADYETVRSLFHRALPPDTQLYNEYHALLVAVGKRHCRATARCDGCPLTELPHEANS